jgi:hypothetical protein
MSEKKDKSSKKKAKSGPPLLIDHQDYGFDYLAQQILLHKSASTETAFARRKAGVHKTVFDAWRKIAEASRLAGKKNCKYLKFFTEIDKQDGDLYDKHYQNISRAGEVDWRASAFILKSRVPEFKDKNRLLKRGVPEDIILDMTNDERLAKIAELLKIT